MATNTGEQGQTGQQTIKISVQHYKAKNVSEEEFVRWLKEEHIPVALDIIRKHGVVRYSLFLAPSAFRAPFNDELHNQMHKKDWHMSEFDAITSYWVNDPDHVRALLADPEWKEKVSDVESPWVNAEVASILMGYETVYIDGGELVNGTLGKS